MCFYLCCDIISLVIIAKSGAVFLVRAAFFEGGAKNPLKGISMKFLVLAYNAQFWVCAGSKGDGAAAMACATDPTLVETIVRD